MNEEKSSAAGRLGMRLFLLSLSVLFTASMVGILVVRAKAATWPPEGAPPLPAGLWLSTGLILLSSWTLSAGFRRFSPGAGKVAANYLLVTNVLALVFLGNQVLNWQALWPAFAARATALYAFSFFLLTVLHALHVLGGVVSLAVVTVKARRARLTLQGLSYAATYWHFLTVVWLVIFALLQVLF
ncbi:MAG: cytochrome c oxidase subunit 3 [Acidobacteriota bacterium]